MAFIEVGIQVVEMVVPFATLVVFTFNRLESFGVVFVGNLLFLLAYRLFLLFDIHLFINIAIVGTFLEHPSSYLVILGNRLMGLGMINF